MKETKPESNRYLDLPDTLHILSHSIIQPGNREASLLKQISSKWRKMETGQDVYQSSTGCSNSSIHHDKNKNQMHKVIEDLFPPWQSNIDHLSLMFRRVSIIITIIIVINIIIIIILIIIIIISISHLGRVTLIIFH